MYVLRTGMCALILYVLTILGPELVLVLVAIELRELLPRLLLLRLLPLQPLCVVLLGVLLLRLLLLLPLQPVSVLPLPHRVGASAAPHQRQIFAARDTMLLLLLLRWPDERCLVTPGRANAGAFPLAC